MESSINKSQDLNIFSSEINNLSFESVQSMPPVECTKNNNNMKQKNILTAKKYHATSKLNNDLVHDFNQSDDNENFFSNWITSENYLNENFSSIRHQNSTLPLSISTPNIFKSIENFSNKKKCSKNLNDSLFLSINNKSTEKSMTKQKKSFPAVFKIPTPILKNSTNKQRKNSEYSLTSITPKSNENSLLRRSPRIKLLQNKFSK